MQTSTPTQRVLAPLAALIPAQPAAPAAESIAELREYARLSPDLVLERLHSSSEGLLSREAIDRLSTYGRNVVAHEAHKSAARRLLELFWTPLSLLLLTLAAVSYLTGEIKGA
ncbi:MAG TPA: cation-transporting P-type ATPase, partial [Burkholderiales bacterium]|nr:cation-transporting P-type ATPase [Burkholderiales bacterium]